MENALHGSFGATQLFGDLRDLKSFETKIRNIPCQGRKPFQSFLNRQLQEHMVDLAIRYALQSNLGVSRSEPHVAFGGTMVGSLRAHLVQRDHDQDFPQLFAGRGFIKSPFRGMEKTAENGLNDVFRIDSLGQLRSATPLR